MHLSGLLLILWGLALILPPSGSPQPKQKPWCLVTHAFTHGPHMWAESVMTCFCRHSTVKIRLPADSWWGASMWWSILLDHLRSPYEKVRGLAPTERRGGDRGDRLHCRMKDGLQRSAAWAPNLPALKRTTDLRETFTREIMCPWKQSQENWLRRPI